MAFFTSTERANARVELAPVDLFRIGFFQLTRRLARFELDGSQDRLFRLQIRRHFAVFEQLVDLKSELNYLFRKK